MEVGGYTLRARAPCLVLCYVTLRLLGEGAFGVEGAMEKGEMDLGPWECNCNNFLGENVVFCMNSKLLAWAKILIVLQLWVDIWSASASHRYLEHMNGLGIIHSHQKCGYVLTFFQFIQVSLSHCVCVCKYKCKYKYGYEYKSPTRRCKGSWLAAKEVINHLNLMHNKDPN